MDDDSRVYSALWWLSSHVVSHLSPESHFAAAYWSARIAELRLARVGVDDWTTDPNAKRPPLSECGRVLVRVSGASGSGSEEAVLAVDDAVVYLARGMRGRMHVSVAAGSDDVVARTLARLRTVFPKQAPKPSGVEVKFWSYKHSAVAVEESVEMCRWPEIAANYTARTRGQLEPLVTTEATESGKLVLWLGPPGTGKTFALRALAWEQRDRISVHYILDPEVFLERIDYIRAVFRDDTCDDDDDDLLSLEDLREDALEPPPSKRARLIVLEDAGELLGADARSTVGHGLSRLLNLTDGLPGQATRTRVLITTNEDVGRLHPAVTRPGRCAALVRFSPLDENESSAWLRARGRDDLVDARRGAATIADLYARLRGDRLTDLSTSSVGFVPR